MLYITFFMRWFFIDIRYTYIFNVVTVIIHNICFRANNTIKTICWKYWLIFIIGSLSLYAIMATPQMRAGP